MKRKLLTFSLLVAATLALSACTKDNGGDIGTVESSVESSAVESSESSEVESSESSSEAESQESEVEPEIDYEAAYASVLDGYYDLIFINDEDYYGEDGQVGVHELTYAFSREELLDKVGYHIEDLSGDGIPELVIGCLDDATMGKEVFAIYTLKDGKPVFVKEGWSRNYIQWLGGGKFFEGGSGGAIYSTYGIYELSKDGSEAVCTDYYFSHEYNGDFEDVRFYHNTTGEWNVDVSELVEEDLDTVWEKMNAIDDSCFAMKFTTMASYEKETGKVRPVVKSSELDAVYIDWAADVKNDYFDYEYIPLDAGDQAVEVAISFIEPVQDFKVLNLEFQDVDEDGKLIFDTEDVFYTSELTMPVVIKMCFAGDIPNVGISFVQDGQTKYYGIAISGMDGSLELVEF